MPWNIKPKGDDYCVYDENGKELKCYPDRAAALKYQRALYANVDDVAKELIDELLRSGDEGATKIVKQDNTTYRIVTVSTAALEDRQGETFTAEAMDYDIAEAYKDNSFPEFRVFHSPALGIGRVDSMKRVGIFAIDEGNSYPDAFSQEICEKMLLNNPDGKWRTSRGFKAIELSLGCPGCANELVINKSHMIAGFRCPSCEAVHLSFKGKPNVNYLKARTFDVSVTDVPVVPMTSAAAFVEKARLSEDHMTKEQLKERLLAAGVSTEAADERLKQVTDEQLKQYDDIPEATLLKELKLKDDDPTAEVGLDELTEAIGDIVKEKMVEVLADFEIELPEFKELGEIAQLKEEVKALTEQLADMQKSLFKDWQPRGDKRRLPAILKAGKKSKAPVVDEDEEDDDDEDDEDEEEAIMKKGWFKHFTQDALPEELIVDGSGNTYKSLTDMLGGV